MTDMAEQRKRDSHSLEPPAGNDPVAPTRRGRPPKTETTKRPPTRVRILAAAAEALMERGAQGLSMEQVATKVGITPGALYRHFEDRAHLLRATLEHILVEHSPAAAWLADGSTVDATQLPTIIAALSRAEAQPMRRFLVDINSSAASDSRFMGQIQEMNLRIMAAIAEGLQRGTADGKVSRELDPRLVARFLLVVLAGLSTVEAIDPTLSGDPEWEAFVRLQVQRLLASG
jgi:AcrR family transcriptional regulator